MNNDNKTSGQPQSQIPAAPVQNPVGLPNKEAEPTRTSPLSELLTPAGPEVKHNISRELVELGVRETGNNPNLTQEHREAGINHAGESVPPQTAPTGLIKLPLTEEEALAEIKSRKPADSGWGFAALVLKVLKAAGLARS